MNTSAQHVVLLLSCPDSRGIVARLSQFIDENNGNILDLDEHVDPTEKTFAIRVVWDMQAFTLPWEGLHAQMKVMAKTFNAAWSVCPLNQKMKVALFVSKYSHCLYEILWRNKMGDFPMELALIVSNHPDLESIVEPYGIPFYCFPIDPSNKAAQEKKELALLGAYDIETVVLARYMQILSPDFVNQYPYNIINIHHSFLPAFAGGSPYKQAFQRGVKIIGATSHYVTEELDDGPIIEQDVIRISHKDSLADLIRKGKDLERLVLARALHHHLEHRILIRGKKTIVFG